MKYNSRPAPETRYNAWPELPHGLFVLSFSMMARANFAGTPE
jgi:hypothetical protein